MIAKEIFSSQHPIIKRMTKLRLSKEFREEQNALLLSGIKLIAEISRHTPIQKLLYSKELSLPKELQAKENYIVPAELFKKMTGLVNPECIAAEVALPKSSDLSNKKRILVLDQLSDPGNLGTLLRTALAFGWEGVISLPGTADLFNDKALRAAKGATFRLPFARLSQEELLSFIQEKKFLSLAADIHGETISSLASDAPLLLILGNEAHGISPELKQASRLLCIPMSGPMESLNVAAAGAILLYQFGSSHI